MKKISLLVSIFFFIFGCEEKQKVTKITKVSGIILDYGSGEPIKDVKILLKDGISGSGPFTTSDYATDAMAIEYTDGNGKFSIELEAAFEAQLNPSKNDQYWAWDDGNSLSSGFNAYSNGSIANNQVFKLKAKAWFDAIISCEVEELDSVNVFGLNQKFLTTGFRRKVYNLKSFEVSTFANGWLATGNAYFRYKLNYKRNNVWNEIIDSVYIEKGEIYRDTIYY